MSLTQIMASLGANCPSLPLKCKERLAKRRKDLDVKSNNNIPAA